MMKRSLCTMLALVLAPFAGCDSVRSTPGDLTTPDVGMIDRINLFVAAPRTVAFTRVDTSATTLELSAVVDPGEAWRLRLELTPDLRAPGVQPVIDGWRGAKDVAIAWEGTFEHLSTDGDAVAIPADGVGETVLDPFVRTLCGDSQRVRARAWVTIDGVRSKALVSLGVVSNVAQRTDSTSNVNGGITGPGNCQIHASWISGWTYSWCTSADNLDSVGCTFVQQTTSSTAQICLSGTVLGGGGSGSGITIGGGGGSGTATGTWGTVTNMVFATFPGNCVHVDGWFEDYCECRATGAPTYSSIPMGCVAGTGGSCATPSTCPTSAP